jgi:LmbE family N-acetylglucosaminyl deacetylase
VEGLEAAGDRRALTMLSLDLLAGRRRPRVLCLGAHSDDIEIGCAGTVLDWLQRYRGVEVTWVVLSASGPRRAEARRSALALARGAAKVDFIAGELRDGHFPVQFTEAKAMFEQLKAVSPDVILTHRLEDRHQDHRLVAELTWQTWRDHLVLEYEIPKYEGDLGQPNVYVPVPKALAERKIRHLLRHFSTQRGRGWFNDGTFRSLMHLRGIESRAPSGFAEAFHARKLVFGRAAA